MLYTRLAWFHDVLIRGEATVVVRGLLRCKIKFEAQSYAAEQEKWAAFGNVASSLTGGVGNIGEGIEMDQALAAANG